MGKNNTHQGGVKSDETLLQIITALRTPDGARITEIANELGIAKSTVYNHLAALVNEGYAVKEGEKYHLSARFLDLGEMARQRIAGTEIIQDQVSKIASETEERAQFVVEEHGYLVYVYLDIGQKGIETDSQLGRRVRMHSTAAGKAILAEYPEEKVKEITNTVGLSQETENTITDYDELQQELQDIRDRGFAVNLEESFRGVRAVAAPVLKSEKEIIGAIAVTGPTNRLKGDRLWNEIPDTLLASVNEAELEIAFS